MKLNFKKIKFNKKIVSIAAAICVLLIAIGVSFAYFSARVIGNDTAKGVSVENGTMALELDGTTIISCENMYPGGDCVNTFTVTNTGTLATAYTLTMIDVNNTFVDDELVYTITSTNNGGVKPESIAPNSSTNLIEAIAIEPNITHTYTITIHFKETGENQNSNQGASFNGTIQINNLKESNTLVANLMRTSKINSTTPTAAQFKAGDPTTEKSVSGYTYTYSIDNNRSMNLTSNISGDKALGDGFVFDKTTGLFTLTNIETNQSYNNNAIGKYTCYDNTGTNCSTVYKINTVQESETNQNYSYSQATYGGTLTSNNNRLNLVLSLIYL